MPEITCFIQLPEDDNTLTIMLDTAITFDEFDNEIKEQLESLYKLKAESLKYAYIDEEDDQISFASNDELKEAFSQALKHPNEYFVILIDEIQRKPEEQSQNPQLTSSPSPSPLPSFSEPQPISEEKEEKEEEKRADQEASPKNHFEVEVDIEDVLNIKSLDDIFKLGSKIMKDLPFFEELENEFKKQKEEHKKQQQQQQQQKPHTANSNHPNAHFPFVHAFGGAAPFPFFPFVVPDCKQRSHPSHSDNNNHETTNNNNRNHHRHPHCGEQKSRSTIIHPAVCDNCNMQIVGIRYKCLQCVDFDFCERCEAQNTQNALHNPQHIFAKIYKPRDVLNIRTAASNPPPSPSPSPSCRGMRFAPIFVRKQQVERNEEMRNQNNNKGNINSDCKSMENENQPRNRFECRVGSLQQRVDSLEAQISEIKQLLINNNNHQMKVSNSEPQVNKEEEVVSAIVQNVEVDSPVVEEKSVNPEPQTMSNEEEASFRMLKDMGFDLSPSIVIENRGNINALVEQLFSNLQ